MSQWRWRVRSMRRNAARLWARQLSLRLLGLGVAAISGLLLVGVHLLLSSPMRHGSRFLVAVAAVLLVFVALGVFVMLTGASIDVVASPQRPLFPPARRRRVILSIVLVAVFLAVLLAFLRLAVLLAP